MDAYVLVFISFFLVVGRFLKDRRLYDNYLSPVFIYSCFYFYFSFGPVIAYIVGYPIYSGINVNYINDSAFIFFLSLLGLFFVPNKINGIAPFKIASGLKRDWVGRFSYMAILSSSVIVLSIVLSIFGFSSDLNKVEKINLLGVWHYAFLTLWPIFLFLYFSVSDYLVINRFEKIKVVLAIFIYFIYCIYVGERDFVLLSVSILFWVFKNKKINFYFIFLLSIVALYYFVSASYGRSEQFDVGGFSSLLNQGSNLLIISNLLSWFENGLDFQFSLGFFSAILNTLTFGIVKLADPMSVWFSREFSSSSNDGAYGFSIDGDILINFGIYAVPLAFFVLGNFMVWCYRGYRSGSEFRSLLTYCNMFFVIYAIRGDFLMIFKTIFYCIVIYFLVFHLFYIVFNKSARWV